MIIHTVYFTLVDKSPETLARFVEDTKNFGVNIGHVLQLEVATRCLDCNREVHDKEFDVVLVSFFPDAVSLNTYLEHPDHLAYCDRNKSNWVKIRVFDAET